MMARQHTEDRTQVEALRAVQEGPTLDYKENANPAEWWELAKDIAAFANHVGGELLVGVGETADNRADPHGLPEARIAEIERAYEHACRDRCRPRPIVTFDRIPWDGGRLVLAVHVEPHPLAPVGAQFYASNQNGQPEPANAWQFPLRVGRHNILITPEQIAMLMTPAIRRAVVLLEAIPSDKREASVMLMYRGLDKPDYVNSRPIRFIDVDALKNTLSFAIPDDRHPQGHPLQAPLEDVEAVWQPRAEQWCVRVSGYMDRDGNVFRYFSRPTR